MFYYLKSCAIFKISSLFSVSFQEESITSNPNIKENQEKNKIIQKHFWKQTNLNATSFFKSITLSFQSSDISSIIIHNPLKSLCET